MFSLNSRALAAEDFSDYYDVSYDILQDGKVKVTQNISIVNNTLNKYVSDYTLNVGSEKIEGVFAHDRLGELSPKISQKDGSSKINLVFKDKVVGAKRSLDWTLEYLSLDTAKKRGSVWEIIIPRLSYSPNIKDYNLELKVPISFGPEMFVSPPADERTHDGNFYHYRFRQETFAGTGIMLAFGESQKFTLDLTYHLKNDNFLSSFVEIALPPDIFGGQQMVIEEITPPPLQIRFDEDGNYLARYKVGGRTTLKVNLKGKVLVFHKAPSLVAAGKISETPVSLARQYTKPARFWEVEDPEIKTIATHLIDENISAAANAKKLYDYVTTHLNYGWEEVKKGALERQGAKKALRNKNAAVCMEYTDLLIALLRAAGIPARRLTGFAYSENDLFQPTPTDSLHTWVQLYLAKVGWISVDPTWGSTTRGLDYFSKLDTNHVVFAINGLSSETPYPAGTYKLSPEQRGDLKIDFLQDINYQPPTANLEVTWLPRKLRLENTSPVAALDLVAAVEQGDFKEELFPGTLPPYTVREFSLGLKNKRPLQVTLLYKDVSGRLQEETQILSLAEERESIAGNLFLLKLGLFAGLLLGLTILARRALRAHRRH